MISYSEQDLLQNGFEKEASQVDGLFCYLYRGKTLKYGLSIDSNKNQVSISGDTSEPFGSNSLYEFHVPCQTIVYKSEENIGYRYFHLSFYRTNETTQDSLTLTVSSRKSDNELVVWPYFNWHNYEL